MLPFLTFAGGIVAGIVGVKLLKRVKSPESLGNLGDKARSGLDKAGAGLREATVTGLSAIEKSSAKMRTKLTPEAEAEAPAAAAAVVPVAKKAAPRRKVATKKKAATTTTTVDPKPEGES
ncbi:hypothetical protein [Magnetospirillum sp. 64-120]|uniref:hypothetical protein n=1 Tax=Magnetospirillum sp. 64-120 TaxID=1895778 RepID=UPI0009281592|nr:hypothetical protein [Magnetospirillum sp. 64-120]OJX78536.1 MAG: hypothetical protein BGO92_01390 [Magnetospirillum sp. 64-120]